jgi:hypothetical protein
MPKNCLTVWRRWIYGKVSSTKNKTDETPSTILAYMIARELLTCDYLLKCKSRNHSRDMYSYAYDDKEIFKITHSKFVLDGSKKYNRPTEWNQGWARLSSTGGIYFNAKEKEIILRAFHKSLTLKAEKTKIEAEAKRQNDALAFIEKWIGLA